MKKTKLFSLALLAAAWLAGGSAQAWDEPAQIDGVYQIGTASELEWFAEYVNSVTDDMAKNTPDESNARLSAQAVLTADIDMTGIDHSPIGRYTKEDGSVRDTYKFAGKFDGQFHTISNLVIDRPNDEALGLFGFCRGNAKIKNVILDASCSIRGKNRVGSIIGLIQTNTGPSDGLEILNCVSFATLTTTSGAAGMIGAGCEVYPYFDMENCVNAGRIDAVDKGTAFCGWNRSAGGNAKMWNCLNIAEIKVLDTSTQGGQLFRGSNRSVANCYDTFTAKDYSKYQGEKPTYKTDDPLHSGEICYLLNTALRSDLAEQANPNAHPFTQDLSDPNSIPLPIPGPTVYQVADLDCAGNPKGGVTYSNTDGGSRDAHVKGDNYICVNCKSYVFDGIENYKSPEEDGFYHLSTVEDVEWFSAMVNKKRHGAMKVKLDNDIDFGRVPNAHTPIGISAQKFFGHFDGQGYRIKGMVLTPAIKLENRGFDGSGFFGSVRGGGTDADGTVNNEVIIENLIIDASCSIEFDNNFAAGVVAHINSRNNEQSNIIIRNCGNEANVSTTGKNAAGILGCVEGTNVGLKLYNLWNKGNIKGNAGESAAICAWTGQRNVNGEVDVEGCWNIGEVTGVDDKGYNLVRRNTNIVIRNVVDLCTTNGGNQGKVSVLNTEDPISSGELCYLLNGDQTDIVYYQTLGTDAMPVYRDATHGQVYQAGTVDCAGAATGSFGYNNVGGETVQLPHTMNDEIGMCTTCYAHYQEPEKVDGYYELKNAGNVEWLSNAIANGGGAAFYAKLMNDIDFLNIENLHNPLGPTKGSKFKGVFDGQGYSIKNMIINRPTVEAQGFFGWLQGNDNTTIKNLIIDSSCSIIGANKCGGLAGASQNESNVAKITIENVVNEADVTVSGQDAAGIVGGEDVRGGKATYYIHNVVNTGTITSTHQSPFAGALFCYQERGAIENFLNLGKIVGHNGGNIGRFGGTWTNVVDLSETDNKTQSVREDLTPEDIVNGKLAYVMGFKQLIGTDEYPSPLNAEEVNYVGEAGYATMYDKANDWALNGDATAYIAAASFDGKYLQLTEVKDVPAGAAVILKGSYYNKLATTATSDVTANELHGTDADRKADGTMYVLAQPEGEEVGFYQATGTIAAGKAYYQSTSGVKAFYFG
ncbi:MAG: hypothetical protein UHJ41_03410, partial [Bacteroidaceae bacterium]|nr:hypothetical protein [Bacteroidaceae bacterium]